MSSGSTDNNNNLPVDFTSADKLLAADGKKDYECPIQHCEEANFTAMELLGHVLLNHSAESVKLALEHHQTVRRVLHRALEVHQRD